MDAKAKFDLMFIGDGYLLIYFHKATNVKAELNIKPKEFVKVELLLKLSSLKLLEETKVEEVLHYIQEYG
ncbi:hypothetical protein [Petroclostridium sp. X23]|uniref:hypothetical protein n=1 Tax=Petroclostridium sp. X23 TaxID=3045146 RepID=UPI0024AD000E|nr:hypothetical protein [Petroclostridium sp. X23]WHH61346.1 hypothetical protein QKW49_11855 [Petroclostridium sp. X23]